MRNVFTTCGLVVLLLGAAYAGWAQDYEMSHLAHIRARLREPALPDTDRVNLLGRLGHTLQSSDMPAARRTMAQTIALARRIHYDRGLARAAGSMGSIEQNSGNLLPAQRYFEQALVASRRIHDGEGVAVALLNMGPVAAEMGNYQYALHCLHQADSLLAGLPAVNPMQRLLGLVNVASVYDRMQDHPASLRANRQCLALAKRLHAPPGLEALILANLGSELLRINRRDSAQVLLTQSRALASTAHDDHTLASALNASANLAFDQHQFAQATAFARQAVGLARTTGDQQLQGWAMKLLGLALHAQHRPEAFDTLARYLTLLDTLTSQERSQAIITAQARFNDGEQQAQIRNLEKDRRLAAQTQELARLLGQRQLAGVSALALLGLLLGGGLLWQYRRRQAARETALRTQLAADLHDDVGTLLSQIAMQSGVLQEGLADPNGQRQQLDQIGEASRTAVRQLNDVVWSLDAHNDHLPNLLDRMRDYAEDVLAPAGLAVRVSAPAELPAQRLPVLLRRNLYLIYKEALHNVLKHAHGATQVAVTLRPEGEELLLEIADDGQPRPETGAAPRRSGHGLRNIKQRAAAVGGSAEAAPLGSGTTPGFAVRVRVPLAVG